VANASVWVWEFYQASTWQSTDVTYAAGSSLEPGFTNAMDTVLAQAAGGGTWADPGTPRVVITWPLPCATLSGTIEMYAVASASAPVQKVEFTIDGAPVGTSTAPPYHVPFTVAATGNHRLGATAFTATSQASTSVPVVLQRPNGACVVPG
jgi:hypothetical protein